MKWSKGRGRGGGGNRDDGGISNINSNAPRHLKCTQACLHTKNVQYINYKKA